MRSGFSLLELSIVLVIIGLLAGGVMTGQSLIRAAELRAVSTEYTRYITALHSFRDKYQAIPGDMKNATAFWGTAGTDLATCRANAGTGTATCNGNGDGRVGGDWLNTANYENYRFWQQLANAGLIEGKYTGVAYDTSSSNYFSAEPGLNVPASKLSNAGFYAYYLTDPGADPNSYFSGFAGNIFSFGKNIPYWAPMDPIMAPDEAFMIDSKLDDGKPGIGRIMAPPSTSGSPDCAIGARTSPAAATYAVANKGQKCMLNFALGM